MDTVPLENILKKRDISPTTMRLLVLDHLLQQKSAISISGLEQLFERSDRITLYRTLKTFEKKGLIHGIQEGTLTKYALCDMTCPDNEHADAHLHYYCTACQETFCLPKIKIPQVNLPPGFRMKDLNLSASGLCSNCTG